MPGTIGVMAALAGCTKLRRRHTRKRAGLARDSQVLQAFPSLVERGLTMPTPADYAAHLGVPEDWITPAALRHGGSTAEVTALDAGAGPGDRARGAG
ncbi:hypothetical protein ACFVU3_13905 [Streptomyces sp. NPDC058052]|uniref:hypothetical protein n=1 Tax=Streptomyces sp. NPDC058052 TaxID=3346316 RepID=UPI0036EAB727